MMTLDLRAKKILGHQRNITNRSGSQLRFSALSSYPSVNSLAR